MKKHFIQADQLLKDSFNLAWKIFESGFKPDYIIGVWRGGAPVGIAVQEFLDFLDIPSDHIAIRTSYYSGIDSRKDEVQVYGLNYVIRKIKSEDSLLIVDDVYETVNDRNKLVKTLAIAKSAIRHNMAKDLPKMTTPTCIIWGKNDIVTPPNVAEEFHELLPDSNLYWIDKCGHAAMMEHPDKFNEILLEWLKMRGL